MALEDVFNEGKTTLILFERGKWKDARDPRWSLAPFGLVSLNGTQYLVPRDTHRAQKVADYAISNDARNSTSWELSQGEWFIEDVLRMGEHGMGDWAGEAGEIWKGVHLFGQL